MIGCRTASVRQLIHRSAGRKMLAVLVLLGGIYLAMPVLAGAFEIGSRSGPKIYPVEMHGILYLIGWEFTTHAEEGKPRFPRGQELRRPWFYGCDSGS